MNSSDTHRIAGESKMINEQDEIFNKLVEHHMLFDAERFGLQRGGDYQKIHNELNKIYAQPERKDDFVESYKKFIEYINTPAYQQIFKNFKKKNKLTILHRAYETWKMKLLRR